MVVIRSADDIILNMVELLQVLQPQADSKPGTVIRDLMIELPASQMGLIYDEIANSSNLQSLRTVVGTDLDNLLANYGLTRKSASKASGVSLYTFSSIPAAIAINKGDLVYASNGSSFAVTNGISVIPSNINYYKSIATKYQDNLTFLNIKDQYAVEVTVQATTPGTAGRISQYGIIKSNSVGISNVTNTSAFSGGSDQENDAAFRNRGLAIFSGSSTGTSLGYKNTALSDSNVLDAVIIGPGDPLMTRDGTIATKNTDGTYNIVSEGTGGKVDICILGANLSEYTDSFVYQDKSNNNDPTNTKNDFILGQIAGDAGKTINRRRIDDIAAGTMPAQPVFELLELTGSESGSNFVEKTVDSLGRVSGNYELIKDTGNFGGSPFGFDKLHWINNKIDLFEEDRIKSKFNGQDAVTYSDVIDLPQAQQSISITNENSLVYAGDKSIVELLHLPATNVTRVFNVNTGERYVVTNQNVDGTDSVNSTGRIRITGNTLPSTSDVLQVDYTWIVSFDPYIDYDGKILNNNPRPSDDSIDWGISNAVRNETVSFVRNTDGSFYSGNVKHPVSAVLSAQQFEQASGIVSTVTTGNFVGRLSVNLTALVNEADSVNNIFLQNSNLEVFNTIDANSVTTNQRLVIGNEIKYNTTIILPSDTPAQVGQSVVVYYNQSDVFTKATSVGNFSANQITIPSINLDITASSTVLRVNYLANIQDALTTNVTNLPISRSGNSFVNNSVVGFTNNSVSNIMKRENQTIQLNSSNQPMITLNLAASDYVLTTDKIITIVSLANGKELWNTDHAGTVGNDGTSYTLILPGYNSPQIGDNVAVFYTADDIKRTQPFTFNLNVIKKSVQNLQYNATTKTYFVNLQTLTTDTAITFSVIDPTTGLSVGSGTGNLTANGSSATLTGGSFMFAALDELLFKQIKISNSIYPNNNAVYDIISNNTTLNTVVISNKLDNINSNQISIVRLLDNKELWANNGTIDIANNILSVPGNTTTATVGDKVVSFIFTSQNLRQAPSRLSVTVADQVNNSGIITFAGTTLTKVDEFIITATNNSLKQNIAEAVRAKLGYSSSQAIPSNILLARVTRIEKVTTTTGNEVLSSDIPYDILGTSLQNNIFYANEMVDDDSLANLDFVLPNTVTNLANVPKIGDKLRVTCYFTTTNDTESLSFTRNGTLYCNKLFAFIEKQYISSGFNSTSVRFIISYFNQPATGSRYKAFYDYTAPKQNERIIIRYNNNRLIGDTTLNIEQSRPINADVLVKSAQELMVDLTINVVIKSDYLTSAATVLQNTKDRLTNAINTNILGDTIDASDMIGYAQAVDGVDRARVIYFNETGTLGQVLSLVADKNQYFSASNIIVTEENR